MILGMELRGFTEHHIAVKAGLTQAEVVALRLYTGNFELEYSIYLFFI